MKKSRIRLCLWLLLAIGLFFSFRHMLDARNAKRSYDEAAEIAGVSGSVNFIIESTDSQETQKETEKLSEAEMVNEASEGQENDEGVEVLKMEELPEEAVFLADIDLESLREVNQDTVGWIAVPGTELSYPLMQGEDNEYYLDRNWKKEPNASGSIFLESTNNSDFSDFHTIVYGHRMRDGSMFGVLKYYSEKDFWEKHPWVYIVLEEGIYQYDIFAAHETSISGWVYRLDLEKNGLEDEFLQFCLESSVLDTGIVPEAGRRILTLSTCTGRGHATRWVVQGYLTRKYVPMIY